MSIWDVYKVQIGKREHKKMLCASSKPQPIYEVNHMSIPTTYNLTHILKESPICR